jgi:hypothetical protein
MFSNDFVNMGLDKGVKELVVYKSDIVYKCSPNQLTRATTLPRNGTGLSLKFICLSAGSLVLYKGL